MPRIVIQWQDQFGRWQRYQEKHNQADAFRTAQVAAVITLDNAGRLKPLKPEAPSTTPSASTPVPSPPTKSDI